MVWKLQWFEKYYSFSGLPVSQWKGIRKKYKVIKMIEDLIRLRQNFRWELGCMSSHTKSIFVLIRWFLLWFSYFFIPDLRKKDQNWHPLLQLRIFLYCLNKTFSLIIQPKDLSQSLKTIMNLMWFLSNFHSQNDLKRNRLLSHYLGFFLKISKSFSW